MRNEVIAEDIFELHFMWIILFIPYLKILIIKINIPIIISIDKTIDIGIHSGDRTQSHGQSILSISFKTINTIVATTDIL